MKSIYLLIVRIEPVLGEALREVFHVSFVMEFDTFTHTVEEETVVYHLNVEVIPHLNVLDAAQPSHLHALEELFMRDFILAIEYIELSAPVINDSAYYGIFATHVCFTAWCSRIDAYGVLTDMA